MAVQPLHVDHGRHLGAVPADRSSAHARVHGGRTYHVAIIPDPAEVGRARREVRGCLGGWGLGAAADTVLLVLSELVSNALRHAPSPVIDVTLTAGDHAVLVEVRDASAKPPVLGADAEPYAEGGRGLPLVAAVTDTWGWAPNPDGGKTTWALVAATPPPACGAHRALPATRTDLRCALQAHPTGPHHALVHDTFEPGTGALWATWTPDGPLRLTTRPDCPAVSAHDPDHACCAYADHPGAHTYDLTDP